MKILILYTRLTDYWLSCMKYSRDVHGNEFLVLREKPSLDAPFKISSDVGIRILDFDRDDIESFDMILESFSADLVYVAGWNNPFYKKHARIYKALKKPVILGMDNHWKGTTKQVLGVLFSKIMIKPYFTDIWIPGNSQYSFARKLGFKVSQIYTGLYCANESLFSADHKSSQTKKILFLGRLIGHKGVDKMLNVIDQLALEASTNLQFEIVGNGPLSQLVANNPNVEYKSFVEPENVPELLRKTDFLILPSRYEAWGVVVHEAMLMGVPVITTEQCGAGKDLIQNNISGFIFDYDMFDQLYSILTEVDRMSELQYISMSKECILASKQRSHAFWSDTLQEVLKLK